MIITLGVYMKVTALMAFNSGIYCVELIIFSNFESYIPGELEDSYPHNKTEHRSFHGQ
jgi:hypothetical protein